MKRYWILIGVIVFQTVFFVCCEKIVEEPDPNMEEMNRPDFLIIGDTSKCLFNAILETYEKNDLIDFDLDGIEDLQYEILSVWEECDETPDPNCNPDSGCYEDYWPTIYTEWCINNIGEYQFCVDESAYPLMFAKGDTISHDDRWVKAEVNLLYREAISNSWEAGNWIVNQDGYLGLRQINLKDTIYAWIRMSVKAEELSVLESSKMK